MFRKKTDTHPKQQYQRDDEGRIVINMTVKDDSDFLSVFSQSDTPVIGSEVAEFLENSTSSILPKEQLTLRIHSDCIDEAEKELYREGIREYYSEKSIANERELKRNNVVSLLLLIAGVLVLALQLILEYSFNSVIWAEVIDIAAWVFLWEAADIRFFGNRSLLLKNKRYRSYLSMKIEYVDITKTSVG